MPRNRRVIDADYYEDDERPRRSNRQRRTEEDSRSNNRENDNSSNSANNFGFDLSNIDFSQIAGMLQNVDMNQLSSMLSGLGGASTQNNSEPQSTNAGLGNLEGILNGLGGIGGLGGIINSLGGIGGLSGILGGLSGAGANPEQFENANRGAAIPYTGDRRVDILYALKPMVTPERASLIDLIIQLYTISKILRR